MLKKLLIVVAAFCMLTGCERHQENTNTVFNREKLSDFTTKPQPKKIKIKPVPMLPGKAQILGAPFQDFPTQVGRAQVAPQKGLEKKVPAAN